MEFAVDDFGKLVEDIKSRDLSDSESLSLTSNEIEEAENLTRKVVDKFANIVENETTRRLKDFGFGLGLDWRKEKLTKVEVKRKGSK